MQLLTTFLSSRLKVLYNPKAFFTHAAWLHQGFPHCAIFPTAASRRSLGRVSVPVWLIILSNQLEIVALVSHYLTKHYSPVRRSSADSKLSLLPLDLHVLSLPPAFNLSHDQTLQLKSFVYLYLIKDNKYGSMNSVHVLHYQSNVERKTYSLPEGNDCFCMNFH